MEEAVNHMMYIVAVIFWGFIAVMAVDLLIEAFAALKRKVIKIRDTRNEAKYAKYKSKKW